MVSLMNGLSAAGAAVSSFAGTAGLEQQKSDLAQQGIKLADQLATAREVNVTQPFAASESAKAQASAANVATISGQFELQGRQAEAGATVAAAGISAAASKYASDATSANVLAEINAAAPQRAEAVLAQREQTVTTQIANQNATLLQQAHADLVTAAGGDNPDPDAVSKATSKIMALETSAGTVAAVQTARVALYHNDLEMVQSLNTRISTATNQLNSAEMEEGSKAALRANIADLNNQLVGANNALKYSSAMARGALAGAPSKTPAADTDKAPSPSNFYTPPGGKPAPGATAAAGNAASAAATPAPAKPGAAASGPSNSPPALLEPISPTGTSFAKQQIAIMDQIDAGKKVPAGSDVLDYANKSPAQRAAIRAGIERSVAGPANPNAAIGLNNAP